MLSELKLRKERTWLLCHFTAALWLCSRPLMHFTGRRKEYLKIYRHIPAFSPPLPLFINSEQLRGEVAPSPENSGIKTMPLPAQAHFEIFSLLGNFHLLEMQIFALWSRREPGNLQYKTRWCHPWFYHLLQAWDEESSSSTRELLISLQWSHIRGKLGLLSSALNNSSSNFPIDFTRRGGFWVLHLVWD